MFDVRAEILDHYKNPHNMGKLSEATDKAEGVNASCGDKVAFELKVNKEGVVEEIAWEGEGCSVSMASASMLSDAMLGKKLSEVKKWGEKEMYEMVGEVNPGRVKCVMLSLSAVKGI